MLLAVVLQACILPFKCLCATVRLTWIHTFFLTVDRAMLLPPMAVTIAPAVDTGKGLTTSLHLAL